MLLSKNQIKAHSSQVGAKTLNLLKLSEIGFKVPDFLVIGKSSMKELFTSKEAREKYSEAISQELRASLYAVRSSALVEDSEVESMAGQFHTEIAVSPKGLPEAIFKVLSHAQEKKALSEFSLLIQAFIEPDLAGVTFTRSPTGGREIVVEFHSGRGQALVSGKIEPQRASFYSSEPVPPQFPLAQDQIDQLRKIEVEFDHPQDIEWAMKGMELYFLQTRPITTLSKYQFEGIKQLETLLPPKGPYFFEKTEISEIAPRPKPFPMSLLLAIYAADGPVARVCRKERISYENTHFLKIIGNELYVDRELELKSLLPSHSIFNRDYSPHFHQWKGVWQTLKNTFNLARLKSNKAALIKELKDNLESQNELHSLKEGLDDFLRVYEVIFEINLLSGIAMKNVELRLKKNQISVSEVLSYPRSLFLPDHFLPQIQFSEKGLKGNSLDWDDLSPFVKSTPSNSTDLQSWNLLSEWKKTYLKPIIAEALFWQHLREIGRWLTVKKVNKLRKILDQVAKDKGLSDPSLISFFNFEELKESKLNETLALNRKKIYQKNSKYTFPEKLTDHFVSASQSMIGLSPGEAEGTLVDLNTLSHVKGPKILYVESLLPELTQHFDHVEGIVSKIGGLLSHLAIVAREKGLPVISRVDLPSLNLKTGDRVYLNGQTGELKPVTNSKSQPK